MARFPALTKPRMSSGLYLASSESATSLIFANLEGETKFKSSSGAPWFYY